MKLSGFFQVSIDYILGSDFGLTGSGMSVSESKAEYTIKDPSNAQAAFRRIEFEGLTQEELDLLAEYAVFIKSRRKK